METHVNNQILDIAQYLEAFPRDVVRKSLQHYALRARGQDRRDGWRIWHEEGVPGKQYEWRSVNGIIQYREPEYVDPKSSNPAITKRKTDVSIGAVDGLRCPDCGGGMYKEGVCPGCADGKKGYKIRLLCGDCDKTILL